MTHVTHAYISLMAAIIAVALAAGATDSDTGMFLALAGIDKVEDSSARTAMLKSMQKAAEKRLDGVTENKRRRHYGHAASLAAACMAVDETNNSSKWFAAIRDEYRRYPALQRELNRYGGGQ